MNDLQKKLFELRDDSYRDFHAKLIPNISYERIIGIRTPALRKFASDFARDSKSTDFLNELPHTYYEENNLHAFMIEKIKDFDEAVLRTEQFLPYVDNWATCDAFSPKVFGKYPEKILAYAGKWIKSDKTYTVRYGIGVFMRYFLDDHFDKKFMDEIAAVRSDEYYVNMMIAWYFATALAKQYEAALDVLKKRSLSPWTHNKAIQKARESHRITTEQKEYLNSLKV